MLAIFCSVSLAPGASRCSMMAAVMAATMVCVESASASGGRDGLLAGATPVSGSGVRRGLARGNVASLISLSSRAAV